MHHLSFFLVLTSLIVCVFACGDSESEKSKRQDKTLTQDTAVQSKTAPTAAGLPQALLARVKVNENGEDVGQADTASVNKDANIQSGDTAASLFESASKIDYKIKKFEDETSSNQGFFHGRGLWYVSTPWYPGKWLGRGLTWGVNPYRFYHGNTYYNYSYHSHWNYGGYRYYYYNWNCGYGC